MKTISFLCALGLFAAAATHAEDAKTTAPAAAPAKAAAEAAIIKTSEGTMVLEFMIQGGDPNTKDESRKNAWGTGGPGYTINAEFNAKHHARGVLSMARTSDPNSAGSQFFICHGDCGQLDGQYTVFGKLTKGDDVLEKIATTPTEGPDRPVKRVTIESVKIVPAGSVK